MKNLLFTISIFSSIIFYNSCTLEMSDNGNFDGFWQMNTVDSLENNHIFDATSERIYWSIQKDLINVRSIDNRYKECIMNFEKRNDSVFIKTPCYYNHDENDTPITDIRDLKPYGINSLNDTFKIERLNSSKMILRSRVLRIYFKKS